MDNTSTTPKHTNLILIGGPSVNAKSAEILANGTLPDVRFSHGGAVTIGPCEFKDDDLGLLLLGPLAESDNIFAMLLAHSITTLTSLLIVLATLSERDYWQSAVPDYLVISASGELLAAGFWGGASGWEWTPTRSYQLCEPPVGRVLYE